MSKLEDFYQRVEREEGKAQADSWRELAKEIDSRIDELTEEFKAGEAWRGRE